MCKPAAGTLRKPKPNIVSFRSGGANGKAMTAFDIKNMDWRPLYEMEMCEDQVDYFYENITGILDRHMPIRTIKKHPCDKPWVTEAMKEAIKARQSALIVGKTLLFNYWRNKVNRMNKTLRASYYKNRSTNTNSKGWYDSTKQLLGQDNNKDSGIQLLANDLYEGDTARLADEVNQFFQSVGDELTPLEPDRIPRVPEVTHDYTITIEEVEKHLSATKVNKSPGLDNIPNLET